MPNENIERAKRDLRTVLRLEPNNAQAAAALERLAPAVLTPEEEEARAVKAAEKVCVVCVCGEGLRREREGGGGLEGRGGGC